MGVAICYGTSSLLWGLVAFLVLAGICLLLGCGVNCFSVTSMLQSLVVEVGVCCVHIALPQLEGVKSCFSGETPRPVYSLEDNSAEHSRFSEERLGSGVD